MRHSEFWELVHGEFGEGYGGTVVRDHVLGDIGHRTGAVALADGVNPRDIWRALCDEFEVPPERRLGIG